MRVTFTKSGGRRYAVAFDREHGPPLVPRHAPGYDDLMPHDLAHFVVEEELGIRLGVFGQLAAGGSGVFRPAPEDDTTRVRRTARRIAAIGRDDMLRSEHLSWVCEAAWRGSAADVDADVARVVRRLDELSARWVALGVGGSLVLEWPERLTVDVGRSPQGRKVSRT
jgi:hypothetical protein